MAKALIIRGPLRECLGTNGLDMCTVASVLEMDWHLAASSVDPMLLPWCRRETAFRHALASRVAAGHR
mgnify:CR=1 FL=1